MPIGRKKKYKRHHRRDNKESSNENGGDPSTHQHTSTQPPLTHTATRSNFDATTTITASINTAFIVIQFLPAITFAVVPSPVATYVVATYDKKDETGR
jgi:hypothetical protein